MDYNINKGVGKEVEFQGLKAQYLFLFAGGLLGVFLLVLALSMAGANQWACILFGLFLATGLIWLVFYLNKKYGTYGLMKRYAWSCYPNGIIHRRNVRRILKNNQ